MESFRIAFFFCKFIPMRTNAAATGAIGGLTTKFLCQQNQKKRISIIYLILWGVKKLHLIILNCVFVGKRRSSAETISVWRGELESGGLFGKKRGDFAIFFPFLLGCERRGPSYRPAHLSFSLSLSISFFIWFPPRVKEERGKKNPCIHVRWRRKGDPERR